MLSTELILFAGKTSLDVEHLLLKEKLFRIILIFEPFNAMRSMTLAIYTVNLTRGSLSFAFCGNLAPCKHMFINAKSLIHIDLLVVYRDYRGIWLKSEQNLCKCLNDIDNENDSH